MENGTWSIVDLPPKRKTISYKWVYKIKYDATGKIEWYKVRLVARGFSQTKGVDYTETFAPVAKFNSIRILLALAAKNDWEVHQLDVKSAYLNGDLKEEIYMDQPEGFVKNGDEEKVCRLHRSLYGLKQAGRSWYEKIDTFFEELGLERTHADNCVYQRRQNNKTLIITIYVDDLLIFASDIEEIDDLKKKLGERFKMSDLGEAHYCLGIQITRNRQQGTIQINQTKYVDDIIERFNMTDCKPIATPMDPNVKLSKEMSPKNENDARKMQGIPYRNLTSSLMYAMTGTRPDIAYTVRTLSKYNDNPGELHWKAAKRAL
jgi:hypothetical protein